MHGRCEWQEARYVLPSHGWASSAHVAALVRAPFASGKRRGAIGSSAHRLQASLREEGGVGDGLELKYCVVRRFGCTGVGPVAQSVRALL